MYKYKTTLKFQRQPLVSFTLSHTSHIVVILLNNCANLWWTVIIILLFYSAIASLFILEVLEKTSSVFFLKFGTGTVPGIILYIIYRYRYQVPVLIPGILPGTGSMYRPCVV